MTALYDPVSESPKAATRPEGDEPLDLVSMDEKAAAKELIRLWTSLDPLMRERLACWEANDLRRQGYTNVRVTRGQDQARFVVFPPPERRGMPQIAAFNKARNLCRSLKGNLLADPPAPQVEPTSDEDSDRDAAELSQRALEDIQSPRMLNTGDAIGQAFDRSSVYGSGFVRYYVDPQKGGRHPKTIHASPLAVDAAHPLVDPTTGMPYGAMQEQPDPVTGEVLHVPAEPPAPVERYIGQRPDGVEDGPQPLTDNPAEAELEWRPGLCREILDGRHVRFLPWGTDRQNAHGVLVGTYITLREARGLLKSYDKVLAPEEEKALTKYRPEQGDYLLPEGKKGDKDRAGDEALVFCLTGVWKECGDYEDGLYIVVLGDQTTLYRDSWVATVREKRIALPLPVAQVRQWRNGRGDPYGDGLMDDLGGANEVRAAQVAHLLQYLDTWNNMPLPLPSTSPITEADLYSRRVIRVAPGAEQIQGIKPPGYEQASLELFQMTGVEMEGDSHLNQTARGMEASSVKSGRHAFQIVAQAHAQLSEPKQHIEEGYLQCCEIELSLTRAFNLTGDTRWQGEDGRFKYQRWQGADLGGDVRLKPGTMTMLSPAAKAELLERWAGLGWIAPDRAQELIGGLVSAQLGRWDDPFLLEIRRSIAQWEEGPPEGYQQPQPMRGVVAGPDGQPMEAIVPAPDPVALALFPQKPHHALPLIAQTRLQQLARALASTKFDKQPPEWQAILVAEFQRMTVAAAPPAPQPTEGGAPGEPRQGAQTPDPSRPASPQNPTLDPAA